MSAPDFAAEIAALETAMARGVLTVESNGERVTYASRADLLQSLTYFRSRAAAAANPVKPASTLAAFDRE